MWYAELRLVRLVVDRKKNSMEVKSIWQGANRIKGAYAYQTLLQYVATTLDLYCIMRLSSRASPNHVLPLGSDFPVEGINPLLGFYAAVTRLSTVGTSPHGGRGWFASLYSPPRLFQ